MDGADWLRTQLTAFGCAACEQPYRAGGIRVLAERDGLWFVDLACGGCGSSAVAIVTVTLDEGRTPRAEAPELAVATSDAGRTGPGPVDADDVLDVHRILATHAGDIASLLRRLDGVEGATAR